MRIHRSVSRNLDPGIQWKWWGRCQQQAMRHRSVKTLRLEHTWTQRFALFDLQYLFWTLSFAALHHRLMHFLPPPTHTHTSLFLSLRFSSFMSPVMNVSHWWHLSGGHTQISDARSHILHARPHSQCHLASAGSDKCFSVQVSFFINIPHKPDLQYPWAIWHITEKIDRSREERKGMECNPGRSHFLFRTPGVSVSSISDVIFP